MKYFSVFTGAGGFEQGMPADWECIGFSEIDKYANMVLRYHWPDIKNYGDINAIDWKQIPDFDLLIGGSPCQDLSLAGKRKGLAGERSGLFFAFAKALRDKLPDHFIWENVKGALSSNQGWDFAEVLNQFSALGYNLWWQVLNAKDFGVPQNRERIFIIGSRTKSPSEIYFEPENSRLAKIEYSQKSEAQISRIYNPEGLAPALHRSTGGWQEVKVRAVLTPGRKEKRQNGRRFKEDGEVMFTLTKQDVHGIMIESGDGRKHTTRMINCSPTIKHHAPIADQTRKLMPLECERLMGWQDNWTQNGIDSKGKTVALGDKARYDLCGNGVVSNVVRELTSRIVNNSKET